MSEENGNLIKFELKIIKQNYRSALMCCCMTMRFCRDWGDAFM